MTNWIQSTTGGGYDFDAKKWIGRFDYEEDVVRPLAAINRMKGSTPVFPYGKGWGVAIHSVACQRLAKELGFGHEVQLAALEHDKHESTTGDIPTPVARAVGYVEIELLKEEIQTCLDELQGIPFQARCAQHSSVIKLIDVTALHEERHFFMAPPVRDWTYSVPQPLYTQPMFDIIKQIVWDGEHTDGGFEAYIRAYDFLRGKVK